VEQLAGVIRQTMQDDQRRYSLVRKLALDLGAIKAAEGGNLQAGLLKELLAEIRAVRGAQAGPAGRPGWAATFGHTIRSPQDLAARLVGSCWRKANGVEVIAFRADGRFDYNHAPGTEWSVHEYHLGPQLYGMVLHWKMDDFRARCEFSPDFRVFV